MDHMPLIPFIAFILLAHCHTTRCLRNFAVNKRAYQSSTLNWNNFNWTADKAVDGNTDGRNPDESKTCSATADGRTVDRMDNHTWEVDIGFLIIVKTIIVYERSDGSDYISGFKVFIGNATRPWTTNLPLLEVQPTSIQHTFRPNDVLARFVSVIRENKNILMICEVVVDGECQKGAYGDVCNETCGHCIYGNFSCNTTDGQCMDGCQSGWRGIRCKEECDKGTYGFGCNDTCGMCLRGSCSTSDGQCQYGCEAGWRGGNCKLECDSGTYGRECAEICGNCLNGKSSCSKSDGRCIDGCECGWRGETCNIDSSEKQTQTCPGVNASAIGGSVGGICVIAIIVNIITVVVLKKRMNKDTSDNEMQMGKVNRHMETVKGEENIREGFQTVDTEYEKLQGTGRIEGSAYSTINYMQTDDPYENNGEGFGIETGFAINGDVKELQSVEEELKAIDERRTVLIRQKKEIQTRLRTAQSATK